MFPGQFHWPAHVWKKGKECMKRKRPQKQSAVTTFQGHASSAKSKLQTNGNQATALMLTQAEEHERKRIAQLLHDELQPLIVGARMHLLPLRRVKNLQRTDELLSQALILSRELTAELFPTALYEDGLLGGLNWLMRWYEEKYDFTIRLEVPTPVTISDRNLQNFIFRAVRELLFNAVKHARIKTANVFVNQSKASLQITVTDQGAGFNPMDIGSSESLVGGYGLGNLRRRMDLLGGSLQIESALGKGSRFTLICPINSLRPRHHAALT